MRRVNSDYEKILKSGLCFIQSNRQISNLLDKILGSLKKGNKLVIYLLFMFFIFNLLFRF